MRIILLLLVLISNLSLVQAQKEETLFNQFGLRLSGVWGGWVSDNSFFPDDNAFNNGGFVTFEFSKDYTFEMEWTGFSGSYLVNDRTLTKARFRSFLFGYNPNSHKVIHPTFRLGLGRASFNTPSQQDHTFFLEPRVGAEINIFQWARLQVNVGGRLPTSTDIPGLAASDLSTFYVGGALKFGVSWGSARKRSERKNDREFEF